MQRRSFVSSAALGLAALLLAAGCLSTQSPRDAGTPDAGLRDAGPGGSNTVVGAAGFVVLSTDSAFGPLPDAGLDPTNLSGFLFDHPGRCGASNKPTDAGVYHSVGLYLFTADLPSIPLGTYQCGDNVPLGGGHVKARMSYLVESVADAGTYEGTGFDDTSCAVTLTQVGSNAQIEGTFQFAFAWLDGGTNTLSGTFNTTPCPPAAN